MEKKVRVMRVMGLSIKVCIVCVCAHTGTHVSGPVSWTRLCEHEGERDLCVLQGVLPSKAWAWQRLIPLHTASPLVRRPTRCSLPPSSPSSLLPSALTVGRCPVASWACTSTSRIALPFSSSGLCSTCCACSLSASSGQV